MLCQKCNQNPVAVLMQQIVNGEKTELHLCQECATKIEMPISFENFFQGFLDSFFVPVSKGVQSNANEPAVRCKGCGMTYADFKKASRLGCGLCYDTFKTPLGTIIKNMQGSTEHQGKFPKKTGQALLHKRKVTQLRGALAKAVEQEEFEEAARLRDEIKMMEQSV